MDGWLVAEPFQAGIVSSLSDHSTDKAGHHRHRNSGATGCPAASLTEPRITKRRKRDNIEAFKVDARSRAFEFWKELKPNKLVPVTYD
jgi:hypothetical protein